VLNPLNKPFEPTPIGAAQWRRYTLSGSGRVHVVILCF